MGGAAAGKACSSGGRGAVSLQRAQHVQRTGGGYTGTSRSPAHLARGRGLPLEKGAFRRLVGMKHFLVLCRGQALGGSGGGGAGKVPCLLPSSLT